MKYVEQIYNGQTPVSIDLLPGNDGSFVVKMPNGAYVTYRPAGAGGTGTGEATAMVQITDTYLDQLNGGKTLKLKFPSNKAPH